jgi:hypothetical protein
MARLAAAAFACAAFAMPLLVARERAVAAIGAMGVLLAVLGIAAGWRWPITGAAGVFLVAYTAALLRAEAAPGVVVSAGLGLAIFLLLQSADLARRARHASPGLAVLLAQLRRWLVLGGAVLAAAVLGVGLAVALAPALPAAAAPFVAGAGAFGIVATIAAIVVRAARTARLRGDRGTARGE